MAKLRTLDPRKRQSMMKEMLAQLKQEDTRSAQWKMKMYHWLRGTDDRGIPHTDANLLFQWFCCNKTTVIRRCPNNDFSRIKRRNHCHMRFLCLACRRWQIERTVEEWIDQIKKVMLGRSMMLGPVMEWEWSPVSIACENKKVQRRIRDGEGYHSRYRDQDGSIRYHKKEVVVSVCPALRSFAEWFTGVLSPRINDMASKGEWLMFCAFDPITKTIRGTYFGPNLADFDYSLICGPPKSACTPRSVRGGKEVDSTHRSGTTGKGGQLSPWSSPKLVRSLYLLDHKKRTDQERFDCVWKVIKDALGWVAGTPESIEDLRVFEAYSLALNFQDKRLNIVRGLRTVNSRFEEHPMIMIERKLGKNYTDLLTFEASEVVGRLHAAPADAEHQCDDANCPVCGESLEDVEVEKSN